jgi:hypothetical protein
LNHHLEIARETSQHVGVAFAAGVIIVAGAFGWHWMPWVFLEVAVLRVVQTYRRDRRFDERQKTSA